MKPNTEQKSVNSEWKYGGMIRNPDVVRTDYKGQVNNFVSDARQPKSNI